MMLPPSPRLRTTTPKHCPSVWTVRCPAMFSVVATIMRDSGRSCPEDHGFERDSAATLRRKSYFSSPRPRPHAAEMAGEGEGHNQRAEAHERPFRNDIASLG